MAAGHRGGRGPRAGKAPGKGGKSRGKGPFGSSGQDRTPAPSRALASDQLQVNGYSAGWLSRGFPWVYRDEVTAGGEGRHLGEVVQLCGPDGRVLGCGLWATQGRVAVRRWRSDVGPIDANLVAERLAQARQRRLPHLPPDTTAWRWAHGENDEMPGLRVDVWDQELAVSLEDPSLEVLLPAVVKALCAQAAPRAIWRADRPPPDTDDAGQAGLLWGQPEGEEIEVLERGLRFGVRPGRRHDVGLFCDMRDVRAWLQPHLLGRRVLNLFAHTGAFSVLAAVYGATEVHTVDLSTAWLARAEDNLRRNGIDPAGHPMQVEDSLAALDRLRRKEERFDLVVADPPSFSHGPRGDWSVTRDLARLVAACCRVLAPGGWLLVASNHGGLSPRDFSRMVLQGCDKAGLPLMLLHEGSTPLDFPAALSFPESRYLKCWVLGS